jgi:hypothetical protein
LFWDHLLLIVQVFKPVLKVLRLCDKRAPAMDQLYYFVRKMDGIITKIKDKLNYLENKYEECTGVTTSTKVVNCWLRQNKRRLDNELIDVQNSNMDGDDSDSYNNDNLEDDATNDLEDNMESVNGDDDTTELNKLGDKIQTVWTKRSKALQLDISIAGWMCSPIDEIQSDCYKNYNGEHRNATTRLYMQWFGHEVKLLFLLCKCITLLLTHILGG